MAIILNPRSFTNRSIVLSQFFRLTSVAIMLLPTIKIVLLPAVYVLLSTLMLLPAVYVLLPTLMLLPTVFGKIIRRIVCNKG